jgi:transcriptional regulator with XRE-family HTH domain
LPKLDAARVRDLRKKRVLTQQELSEQTGHSLFTQQRIERGEGSVRPKTARELASVLDVSVEEILLKDPAPLQLELEMPVGRGYLPLSHLLEDWRYLIESTAERHIHNASSNLFETTEGACAYSIAAYTETAQLFEICLERLSPTITNALPESLAEIESGKLARSMFRLEEAQEAISKTAKAAGVDLEHDHELSEEEIALIDETVKEYEALSELEKRRWDRDAWEIVDRLAETHIANARELTEEVRNQSSA